MHLDDKELIRMQREEGARIIATTPAVKPPAPPPSDAEKIISAIRALDGTLVALSQRPAPNVEISPTEVSVKPQIHIEAQKPVPRKWKVEVTERDKTVDHRIKSMTIEAID